MSLRSKATLGQAHSVYEWTYMLDDGVIRTLDHWRGVVEAIWRRYRSTTPPQVKDGRGHPFARASRHIIHLPRDARSVGLVLHEVAHALTISEDGYAFVSPDCAGHGPGYAKVFAQLLVEWGTLNEKSVWAAAKNCGVVIAD